MEGRDFIVFQGNQINEQVARDNYNFWKSELDIPEQFDDEMLNMLSDVKKMFGAHTFPAKVNVKGKVIYPLLSIFQFDEKTGEFNPDEKGGIVCDKIRNGDGQHMGTARELGLDVFVFSYMGTHLPYHREKDLPPVCPFGLFIKTEAYANNHGSPCDRDYRNNDLVDSNNIDKYFLLPEDLQKVIAHRILTDNMFGKDFWKYYGNPQDWVIGSNYVSDSWKKKGELCYYNKVSSQQVAAILWPMWEENANMDNAHFEPDDLQELTAEFGKTYTYIQPVFYRPYRDVITANNWNQLNQRDWELALIEASSITQRYYMQTGDFPDSVETARAYLNI